MIETVRYAYRLRPGRQAQAALLAEWGRCRWLWNEAVHQQKTRRRPTICKLSNLLTEARGRRRPKGAAPSKGYLHAKRHAARIEKKAARQNTHDARQWAARVVEAHHLIAVEDFKPKFLAKSRMARKAADAAIGACKRELIYRGSRAGRIVAAERNRASADDIRQSIASFRGGASDAVRAGNPRIHPRGAVKCRIPSTACRPG